MIVQLWNWLPEELKTIKQRIICTYVTEHLFVKKKNDKKNYNYNRGKYRKCLSC